MWRFQDKRRVSDLVESMKRTINTTCLHIYIYINYCRFIVLVVVVVVVVQFSSSVGQLFHEFPTSSAVLFLAADLARIFRCGRPGSMGAG